MPRPALGPLLIISLLIILFATHRPDPRPRIAPPWAMPDTSGLNLPPLPALPDLPDFAAGQRIQRPNLDVMVAPEIYRRDDQILLAVELEQALVYVGERFGSGPAAPIQTVVQMDVGCMLNGAAFTDARQLVVYACSSTARPRVVAIAAHEFVHQLAHDRYGPTHQASDLIILEGLATWGAGTYWLSGMPSFRAFVQRQYSGQLLPLATPYQGRPIADMNKLYYQWASFVEFLIETYGRERLDALATTGTRAPGSGDYSGIYGKGLDVLEQEWLVWLAQS
ncbi:MAG: hypothetical protein HC876_01495 [Chloroflexaceae bacterium]|nr:hypothetical protein [Chloroflexaceae bacterium]